MKARHASAHKHEAHHEHRHGSREAGEFHDERLRQEKAIEIKTESSTRPTGNYEYEQLIAENAGLNAKPMIEVAAYYIAQRRDFSPGHELSDWLLAEAEIEACLRGSRSLESGT